MGATRPTWSLPGINERLIELHALSGADYMTTSEIAQKLSAEFKVEITKNSVIGRSHRLGLELRDNVPFERRKATPMPKRSHTKVDAPIAAVLEPRCEDAGISIYQLREGDCHWPLGEVEDRPPFTYCGAPAEIGRSYCWDHFNRAHVRSKVWS
jgi:hypothetical protein